MAHAQLTRALVCLLLGAALVTAPLFLFAEGFSGESLRRVGLSNGAVVVLCWLLLGWLARGRVELAAHVLVFGLFLIVAGLVWTNGEPVHVNVVNFVLVLVLASTLTERRSLALLTLASAFEMCLVAWRQARASGGESLSEARLESIVQFLPSFLVIAAILALRTRPTKSEPAP